MGCGHSQPEAAPSNRPVPLQHLPDQRSGQPSYVPHAEASSRIGGSRATKKPMRSDVRRQFLHALHSALHDVPYTVIGGSALAEYGSTRETADVDVLVSEGISKRSAESLLVNRTGGVFQRLGQGKLGYRTANGDIFPLDLTVDAEIDLPFDVASDTQIRGGARVANMIFLLNSKARAWQTRVPFEQNYQQKRENDARDIAFCLHMLQGQRGADPRRLNWLYTKYFWHPFLQAYPQMEQLFRRAGLWTDQTDFPSDSSAAGRSSQSNWSRGSFGSQNGSVRGGWGSNVNSREGSRAGSRTGSMR